MAAKPGLEQGQAFWWGRLVVLALLLLGAGLRLVELGELPAGLYQDEAQHGIDALDILDGRLQLYFRANNGREPLFVYLVAAAVACLGRSPIAVRLPSFFVGVLTLAATYDLASTLWGRRAGRRALAVLAVTLWHVHLSRVGFRAVLLPLFTPLYLSHATKAIRRQQTKHWIIAGILYGASWYTYMAARFTPIAIGAVGIYGLLYHRPEVARRWRGVALAIASALVILLPLGLYTLAYPDVVLARSGQVSVFSHAINQGQFWSTLGRHALATAGMFTVQGDRIWRHNLAWRPVWDPALGLAFTIGIGVALARFRRKPAMAVVLLWTLVMTLPTLLAEDAPHFLRGVGVLPTAALLPAIGLGWLSDRVGAITRRDRDRPGAEVRAAQRVLPCLFVAAGLWSTVHGYFIRYRSEPLASLWFEAGPVQLAGEINSLRGAGWDGSRMLHDQGSSLQVYMDRQIWDEWSALSFLLSASTTNFLPLAQPPNADHDMAFAVWPHRDWASAVLPHLPHPSYMQIRPGPSAQGDRDPEPFTIATIITAQALPEVPTPVGQFENGILLRAALVQRSPYAVAQVHLWWEATSPIKSDYTVFVHYLRDGSRVGQHDGQPAFGHLRTSFWRPGDLILDLHPISGLTPLPAGDTLRVGLYDAGTGEGLPVVDAAGATVPDAVELPVILIERP